MIVPEYSRQEPIPSTIEEPASEVSKYTTFEHDSDSFLNSVDDWKSAIEKDLTPTKEDLSSEHPDYVLMTNTTFDPYNVNMHQKIDLKSRGAPIVICREATQPATGKVLPDDLSVYCDPEVSRYIYSLWQINNDAKPQHDLAFDIGRGSIHPFQFDPKWRGGVRDLAPKIFNIDGILWAEEHGLEVNALLTSMLVNLTDPYHFDIFHKNDELLEIYERLAIQIDERGYRKFVPLNIEQFAGLSLASLHKQFAENPELNEALKLSRPYPK